MIDIIICYSVLTVLGFWTLYWMIMICTSSPAELERFAWRETQAGRKVSFWATPKGQTWAARIAWVSLFLWIIGIFFVSFYLQEEMSSVFFISLGGIALFSILVYIVAKLFGLGAANHKPTPEELERAQKIIEEREKAQEQALKEFQKNNYMVIPPVIKP